MNIYRLLGDGSHDVGILLLLYLVFLKGNASGELLRATGVNLIEHSR